MLADALIYCAHFGVPQVLVTCEETNLASRRVIEANHGRPDGVRLAPQGVFRTVR